MSVINIDERAGSFEPLEIVFRGETFTLGATALSLFTAGSIYGTSEKADSESQTAFALRLLAPMLIELDPEMKQALDKKPLTPAEEFAFLPVLTEVVKRVGAIRFSETD